MRTTVTLDPDIYEAAMQMSQTSGKRLGQVLSELARRGLRPPPPAARQKSRRFPTFEIPADAPMISVAKLQRIIDEEGLF